MEELSVACYIGGHLLQVVGLTQIVADKTLILQVAAISINLHLAQIGEAQLAYEGTGELIEACRRDAYLGP